MVCETDDVRSYSVIRYFKYFDGTGDYEELTYDVKRADLDAGWVICQNVKTNFFENAARFSLKKLLSYC